MVKIRRIAIAVLAFAGVIGMAASLWFAFAWTRHSTLLGLLRAGQLAEARVALNGYHDWTELIRQIELSHDPALVQSAFDVQFENWHSKDEDTNYPYTERPDIIARLLALGAVPTFEHLLRATRSNKSETAWLLLGAGVPAAQPASSDTPLANAAYYGDMSLAAELLRRGADPNQASEMGWRPVLAAAWSRRVECVRFLLDHGADLSLLYEVWEGNTQPIWKVIEERTRGTADPRAAAVWDLVRERLPDPGRTPP